MVVQVLKHVLTVYFCVAMPCSSAPSHESVFLFCLSCAYRKCAILSLKPAKHLLPLFNNKSTWYVYLWHSSCKSMLYLQLNLVSLSDHYQVCQSTLVSYFPSAGVRARASGRARVCLSMCGGEKLIKRKKMNCRWPKTATGSCVVQDQTPQQ